MKTLTLAFLFRENQILLAMKKRGFGVGKWNGYGGKVHDGESNIEAIIREVREEGNIILNSPEFQELGHMHFYFDDKSEWNQKVIVYRVGDFTGEPEETEEMKPEWFEIHKIPWNEMWKGDDQWIPKVIKNESFIGEIHFKDQGETVVSCVIK